MKKISLYSALKKAGALERKGALREAEQVYEAILDPYPGNKQALRGLLNLKNPPAEVINQLIQLLTEKRLFEAARQAKNTLELYPDSFRVWNILGAVCREIGWLGEASKAFHNVTLSNPNYPDGYNNLGATLREFGDFDGAIIACQKAIL